MNGDELSLQLKMKGENISKLKEFLFKKEEIIKEKIKNEETLEKIKLFNEKYSTLKDINRFCIPIIGKCNSGKSTFLNYLLNQKDILETDKDISTRFICIIRHDPSLSYPKLYKANINLRDTIFVDYNGQKFPKELYNFEEGEEIEIDENIEKIIKKKNKELINESIIIDYFLIMRINIPLFNSPELAPYADCFELMDIPGLNETSNIGNENYYLEKLFPYFINNVKFCFFIFDATEYHSTSSTKIFNDTLSFFEDKKHILNNSIFIFNKIDLPENKELAIQNFENYLKETLHLDNINYIKCASTLLILNSIKYHSFLNYIEYIFNEKLSDDKENFENPNDYIREKLKEDFNIKVEENLDDDYDFIPNNYQEKEYTTFEEKIQNITPFQSKLNKKDYFYYKNYFAENANKKDTYEVELKIKNLIVLSCKRVIDSYLDFTEYSDLMDKILANLGMKPTEIQDIKNNFGKKEIKSLKKSPIEIYDSLNEIIIELKNLKNHEYLEKISDEYSFFGNFIKNEIKIRIPTLGCYSSGKSSLLNNIIGCNLLPTNTEVSTNIGIIINHTNSINDICLKKSFLKKSVNFIEDYYYFDDSHEIIYTKFDYMKEILLLMNNACLYENKIVDNIISFIKKLEKTNHHFIETVNLLNEIFLYKKQKDLKAFEEYFDKLKNNLEIDIDLNGIYIKIKSFLNSIIQSKLNNKRNIYLRNLCNKVEEDSFLKLTIPVKIFEFLKLEEDLKKQIEFIDFPGLNSENNLFDKQILNPLIKFSNGFLFVSKCSIKEGNTTEIINSTISKISNRKMLNFSFDSMLFILTHCENSKLNLGEKRKEIYNAIFSNDVFNSNILNQNNFLICEFSNTLYKNFLNDLVISESIEKLYNFLKIRIKNISPNDPIKFIKKLKKDLNDTLLSKLQNKNNYQHFIPQKNIFNQFKNELLSKIDNNSFYKGNKENKELNNILDEFIKLYIFFKDNSISNHQDFIRSKGKDFHLNILKVINNSKISFNKTMEKSIIYFMINLRDKLEKININFILNKVDELINKQKMNDAKNKIEIEYENSHNIIIQKIDSHLSSFQDDINLLINDASNTNLEQNKIEEFTSKWQKNNEKLQKDIQKEILNFAYKIEEKIEFNKLIEKNQFEFQEKLPFLSAGHIALHGVVLGIEGIAGGISAAIASSVGIPAVGIAVGAGILIHIGICVVKYMSIKKKNKEKLIQSIYNYSHNFNDNIDVFKNSALELILKDKEKIINQIEDNYLTSSLNLNNNEEAKFKVIINLFKKNLEDNFKLE